MALANFFDKTALGASQILKDYERNSFEKTLNNQILAIVFGKNATSTHEGNVALELLIRLSARLYPNLQLINTTGSKKVEQKLLKLSRKINPEINLEKQKKPTVYLIAGRVTFDTSNITSFYIGSKEWVAFFSNRKKLTFSETENPFGSGAAVCFGMANVFRNIFQKQLPKQSKLDSNFSFSVLNYEKNPPKKNQSKLEGIIDLGEVSLVGVGAIGNSFLWSLKNTPSISEGTLNLIDNEKIDLSNLQRYILSSQDNREDLKVDVAEEFMRGSNIKINKCKETWQKYTANRGDWNIEKVAVCVDSAEDRISIQASLPKLVFNAWTQIESIGISRHLDFLNQMCLACLYLPEDKKRNRSEVVASNLGIVEHEKMIRNYLAEGSPVDKKLLNLVSRANNRDIKELEIYLGQNVEIFHSKVVCGGVLIQDKSNIKDQSIEVPSAFESALAGILLAAEIVIDAKGIRKNEIPNISRINLLRPISDYINENASKHHLGNCICHDDDFRQIYKKKFVQ